VKLKDYKKLPYRACVGIMLINAKGRVFVGRRLSGPEHIDSIHSWQMPQGGVDEDEDTYKAALRELFEETSVKSVKKLGASRGWLKYDIPRAIVGEAWKGKFRGQKQKWYALHFTGKDSEINVLNPGDGHKPEFAEWRWEKIERLPGLVIPFKRGVYEEAIRELGKFARIKQSAPKKPRAKKKKTGSRKKAGLKRKSRKKR
jgi:putative (di)nucleoside polyphosphate hydrolase